MTLSLKNPAGNPTSSIGINRKSKKKFRHEQKIDCSNPTRVWMIPQFFPEIQGHPYPLQTLNPVQGMDDIAIFIENPDSSIMQNEKNLAGNPTSSIGGYGQKME